MATQTITLPARTAGTNTIVLWTNVSGLLVNSELVDGGGTAYIRYLLMDANQDRVTLRMSSSDSGAGSSAGPDFTTAIETMGTITFAYGDETIVLDSSILDDDTSEPYVWDHSDLGDFITELGTNAGATITIDDGISTGFDFSLSGSTDVTAAYVGSTEIEKIYLGGTEL